MKQYATLGSTVYFWFAGNDTSGSGDDGASPAADVRLAGAAVDAIPVLSPTPVLLTHANYPAGCYEVAIAATTGNGFAINNTYAVFCTLAVDAQNPTGFVGSFDLKPVLADAEDSVCDAILTGANHNIATSLGRRIREIGAFAIHGGTAQVGTSVTITIDTDASANDGVYNRNLIAIIGGTGIGQTRQIADYVGSTKVVTVDREWRVTPDATSEFVITASNVFALVDQGQAQAGTATTIKLRPYASSIDDTYLCNQVVIIAGTGRGQSRLVGAYNGSTKVATICGDDWVTIPDITSTYVLLPYGTTCTSCVGDSALALIKSEVDDSFTDYDPPTQTEATELADAIITEVNANETKIDDLNDITVAQIIAGIADGTYDLQEMMRIMFAVLSGKSAGGGTPTLTFRDGADSKNRIAATVDANGNRIDVTLDGS